MIETWTIVEKFDNPDMKKIAKKERRAMILQIIGLIIILELTHTTVHVYL